jgi:hypothetical protein
MALGGIALIGFGVVFALGLGSGATKDNQAQLATPVRSVHVDSASGSVRVRAGDVPVTTVHQRFSYHWGKPDGGYRVNGDQLVLNTCGWKCTVDYDVVVPRGVTVTGHADSGDIDLIGVASADVSVNSGGLTVRDVAGSVKAQADSGDIALAGIGQDVTAKAGSGRITGETLRGKVDAQADSGSVTLRLGIAQDVRARSDSGDVDVTVPNGSYRVQGTTDSGDRMIGVPVDAFAARTLQLDTDSGDVRVRPA